LKIRGVGLREFGAGVVDLMLRLDKELVELDECSFELQWNPQTCSENEAFAKELIEFVVTMIVGWETR
jgi:hypothetical protein